MIGRIYKLAIGAQAQTAAKCLMEIGAPADGVVFLERASITQSSFDTSENLAAKIEDVTTTGTGTDSSASVNPVQEGDAAFGGTFETNSTVDPTYSGEVLLEQGFNCLSGFLWTPASDDEVIAISPSGLIGIQLDVAISSMNLHYGCTIRVIGG